MDLSYFARVAAPLLARYKTGQMEGEELRRERETQDAAQSRQIRQDMFNEYARRRQADQVDAQLKSTEELRKATLKQAYEIQKAREAQDLLQDKMRQDAAARAAKDKTDAENERFRTADQTRRDIAEGNWLTQRTVRDMIGAQQQAARENKPLPSTAKSYVRERLSLIRQLDDAAKEAEGHQNAFGFGTWITNKMGQPGRTLRNTIDPKGIQARGKVGLLSGIQMHDLAGATVPRGEQELYAPGVAAVGESYPELKNKLDIARQRARNDLLSFSQVYGVPLEQLEQFASEPVPGSTARAQKGTDPLDALTAEYNTRFGKTRKKP